MSVREAPLSLEAAAVGAGAPTTPERTDLGGIAAPTTAQRGILLIHIPTVIMTLPVSLAMGCTIKRATVVGRRCTPSYSEVIGFHFGYIAGISGRP